MPMSVVTVPQPSLIFLSKVALAKALVASASAYPITLMRSQTYFY